MANLELTVLARSPRLVLARAEALGLDRSDLLQASGFSELELKDLDARVSRAKMVRLWRRIAEAVPDPALGLRPRRLGGCAPARPGRLYDAVLGHPG